MGMDFSDESARREHYLGILKEILASKPKNATVGMPIGDIEDVLRLSDPPFYTACANPWLSDFIKVESHQHKKDYHREPFCGDVSEGKNHIIYKGHAYPTKVPHRAIMKYLLHYTSPGDVVLDAFAGTGMTGVAAKLCGDIEEIKDMNFKVDDRGVITDNEGVHVGNVGQRKCILNDLSPSATFISYSYNCIRDKELFIAKSEEALKLVEEEMGWMYATLADYTPTEMAGAVKAIKACRSLEECRDLLKSTESIRRAIGANDGRVKLSKINFTIWSDVFGCPECGQDIVFWKDAVDRSDWSVRDEFACPGCKASLKKDGLERKWTLKYDPLLKENHSFAVQRPVAINSKKCQSEGGSELDEFDNELIAKIAELTTGEGPLHPMPDGANTGQPRKSHGLSYPHHFYFDRAYHIIRRYAEALGSAHLFTNISSTAFVASKLYRLTAQGGSLGAGGGPMNGTLYVPSLIKEIPVIKLLREHARKTAEILIYLGGPNDECMISTGDASSLQLPESSVDYIFVDPPFGGNINYSELSFLRESWLRVFTNTATEAITNKTQEKGISEYAELMYACFAEFYRVLKPGHWITVEFSNTKASVWNAIQSVLQRAGFVVANVAALDKKQGSFKAVTSKTAVKQDLVISAYKPSGEFQLASPSATVSGDWIWEFMALHIGNLPVTKIKDGNLDYITERDPRILYDRMLSYCLTRSIPVPISASEFQLGLEMKFAERDGMFFLSSQAVDYDKRRLAVKKVSQLSIFVEDERSAILWLRGYLKEKPVTSQDLQAEFLKQLGASWKKWEVKPELGSLLMQNFLCYDGQGEVPSPIHSYLSTQYHDLRSLSKADHELKEKAKGRWYVPDIKRTQDVEMIRNKRLLNEFCTYLPKGYSSSTFSLPGVEQPLQGAPTKSKKLVELRAEAVRAGFKACYQKKDYRTIIVVAELLPESLLQEDEYLQMIYDNAVTRTISHNE